MKGFRFLIGLLALGSLLMVPVGAQALPVSSIQINNIVMEVGENSFMFPWSDTMKLTTEVTEAGDYTTDTDPDKDGMAEAASESGLVEASASAVLSEGDPSELLSEARITGENPSDLNLSVEATSFSGLVNFFDLNDFTPTELTFSFDYSWAFDMGGEDDDLAGDFKAGFTFVGNDNNDVFLGITSSALNFDPGVSNEGEGYFSDTYVFNEIQLIDLNTSATLSGTLAGQQEAPVPEPGTWLLLSLGVAGLPLLYRRQKQG